MIDGVETQKLKVNADERGYLVEVLRSDWAVYEGFAQAYVALNYPGIIRAWHYHRKQTDHFVVVKGMVKVALYDAREGSPTHGQVDQYFLGEQNPILLKIPVGVYHGYKTIGLEPSYLLNFPTQLYNPQEPDEFRAPYDSEDIPYDWDVEFK